jgi:hypothetical protein
MVGALIILVILLDAVKSIRNKHCQHRQLEIDPLTGIKFCKDCGKVIEDKK